MNADAPYLPAARYQALQELGWLPVTLEEEIQQDVALAQQWFSGGGEAVWPNPGTFAIKDLKGRVRKTIAAKPLEKGLIVLDAEGRITRRIDRQGDQFVVRDGRGKVVSTIERLQEAIP